MLILANRKSYIDVLHTHLIFLMIFFHYSGFTVFCQFSTVQQIHAVRIQDRKEKEITKSKKL